MTDGLAASVAWFSNATITVADVDGLTGWLSRNPALRFHFDGPTRVDRVTSWWADHDGVAGVSLPTEIRLSSPSPATVVRAVDPTEDPGSGSTVPIVTDLPGWTVTQLDVVAARSSSWTMASEVVFAATAIPEPGFAVGLVLVAVATWRHRRRRS